MDRFMSIAARMSLLLMVLVFVTSHVLGQDVASGDISADVALKKLQEGNARFVAGKSQHPHETSNWRARLEEGQHPFAVILGCSDSRVPPELVFDQGFGDIFVIRVAGNVVDTDVIASIEYAIDHLDTKLIYVMGHSDCGAVSATIDHLINADGEPAEVVSLLYQIEPAVMGVSNDQPRKEVIAESVNRNIQWGLRRLSRVPDVRQRLKDGRIKIVGGVYDIHTGKVNLLE